MDKEDRAPIHLRINIIVEDDEDRFYAYCPGLKGLHTCGDTEEEATNNAADAAIAYLRSLIKHGEPIPIGVVAEEEEIEVKDRPLPRKSRFSHIRDVAVPAVA